MRELNAGGHKLRRPSFSNTLTELPEVEEPEYVLESSPCHVTDGGATTTLKVLPLPPIGSEDIVPSPRPRFNTIPEGVTERPKYLETTKSMKIDTKLSPVNERKAQRHSYPGRVAHFQNFDPRLAGPHKSKVPKRRRSSDFTARRSSFSSDNVEHSTSTSGHSIAAVPPIQRSSEIVPPQSGNKIVGIGTSNAELLLHKKEKVCDNEDDEMMNKNFEVIKWRKALDKAKSESPCGSFENLAKSIANDEGYRSRRRFSMPSDPAWDRRMSHPAFEDTSRKVDILLRYGKALRDRYHHNIPTHKKSGPPKTIRTLADFMIEMPKKPRFSSFMSPEAQYALMKGYEDKLYRKLSSSLPEYNPLLKRNKTPKNTSVDIKPKNTLGFLHGSDTDGDDGNGDDDNEHNENNRFGNDVNETSNSFLTQIPDDNASNLQSTPPTVITDSLSMKSEFETRGSDDTKTVLRNLRRLSVSLGKEDRSSINKTFHGGYDNDDDNEDICSTFTTRQRSHSMPSVSSVPFQRRLMMSYRLQSAMDILDNIATGQDTKLSPRLRTKRSGSLTEYNAWVSEWNNEFCLKNCHG